MCFIIRIEEKEGLFRGYFRVEELVEAHRLYNRVLESSAWDDTVVKLLDSRLNILKSNIDLQGKEKLLWPFLFKPFYSAQHEV